MSDLLPVVLATVLGLCAAAGLVLWRIWPVLRGRVRPADDAARRLERWNRHLAPFLRRVMKAESLVATGEAFAGVGNGHEPEAGTIAVWCLSRTVLPDVDWVALARPVAAAGGGVAAGEVIGAVRAARLRELLGGQSHRQVLFGHVAHVYVWPADTSQETMAAIVAEMTPIDEFQIRSGWAPPTPAAPSPEGSPQTP